MWNLRPNQFQNCPEINPELYTQILLLFYAAVLRDQQQQQQQQKPPPLPPGMNRPWSDDVLEIITIHLGRGRSPSPGLFGSVPNPVSQSRSGYTMCVKNDPPTVWLSFRKVVVVVDVGGGRTIITVTAQKALDAWEGSCAEPVQWPVYAALSSALQLTVLLPSNYESYFQSSFFYYRHPASSPSPFHSLVVLHCTAIPFSIVLHAVLVVVYKRWQISMAGKFLDTVKVCHNLLKGIWSKRVNIAAGSGRRWRYPSIHWWRRLPPPPRHLPTTDRYSTLLTNATRKQSIRV